MIEITFAQKILGAAATLIAGVYKVLVDRKKRQRQEFEEQGRACKELFDAIRRKLHPLCIQIAFAKMIGHRKFGPLLINWILRQPDDPIDAARRLLRVLDYVAPTEGGRLLKLKSVAANTVYRRTAIIVCVVLYVMDFPSVYHGLYVTVCALVTGSWNGVPATLSLCAIAAGAGVCALREGGRLYAAAKLVAEQTR